MAMIAKPSNPETWKGVQWHEQGLGSFNKVVVEDCVQKLAYLWKKLYVCLDCLSTMNEV